MRKSVIGLCVALPLAVAAVACSSSDDSSSNTGGAGGAGATSGSHAGGTTSGGGTTGGTSSGGKSSGGTSGAGTGGTSNTAAGALGVAGTDDNGSAGEAGAAPVTPVIPAVQPAVYTMSNAIAGNMIYGFLRAADGSLTPMAAAFPTAGTGSGASLGEQGAVAYDLPNKRIYAVNAGDNSFSVLQVKDDGTLGTALNVTTAGFGAGAAMLIGPKSITFHGNTVYVLYEGNAATPSMIAGYALTETNKSVDPAQIEFTPDGAWLVVTEKQSGAAGAVAGPGSLDTFGVDQYGVATKKGFYATAKVGATDALQMTPFGFEFLGNTLLVSEAGSTGLGSYTYAGGVIAPALNAQFLPTDPAPCWVAVSSNWAYVANAQGPDVSGFTVGTDGSLSNIGPIKNAVVASTGKTIMGASGPVNQGPTDEFVSEDGKFLYVMNSAVPAIGVFAIDANGTLSRVGATDYSPALTALPVGAVGIVAR
jgi:6-phosphogluconolactonase